MSWRDRPYAGGERAYDDGYGSMAGGVFGGMRKPPQVVKWLLIINFVVFFIQILTGDLKQAGWGYMTEYFGVIGAAWWQLWRYVTFQFLHGGVWHIAFNMLGLYFMGTPLEQRFGGKWFLRFYLTCGAAAGVMYMVMALLWNQPMNPLVGASGGVYAILLAAAVYFPHFRVILMFFPVPIRTAAVLLFGVMIMTVLTGIGGQRSSGVWSQVAHFGGAAAGGLWLYLRHNQPVQKLGDSVRNGRWEKKMQEMRETQRQADEILEKIHGQGIHSLSAREKRILKKATEMQKDFEDRADKL